MLCLPTVLDCTYPNFTQTLEADLVLWAAGMGPSPKMDAVRLPFPANERGCTQTDETLQVVLLLVGSARRVCGVLGESICVVKRFYLCKEHSSFAHSIIGPFHYICP